jgi:hypothetical protein
MPGRLAGHFMRAMTGQHDKPTLAGEFAKSHGNQVKQLIFEDVITARQDTPLAEIAAILERRRISRIRSPATGVGRCCEPSEFDSVACLGHPRN